MNSPPEVGTNACLADATALAAQPAIPDRTQPRSRSAGVPGDAHGLRRLPQQRQLQPQTGRGLSTGGTIGFEVPGMGVFYPPNLTPDAEAGIGKWSEADIINAVRAAKGLRVNA
ncbi:MAG TPA: hypothetical protein VFM42_07370 [Sphingomicrobium sp.]|nr:hypothetical protein [Sphingomicrobium sp.]